MSKKDVSIVFKADSTGLINSLNSMKQQVNGLSKDVKEFEKIKNQAIEKRTEINLDITKAQQAMKDLKKAVKDGAEGSEEQFKKQAHYLQLLQDEYKRLGQVASHASNEEMKLRSEVSKTSNMTQSRSTLAKGLMQAGLGNMLGQSVQNASNTFITSVLGSNTGGLVSGLAGSAISGAAIGSILPGVGTAIGAGVGAIVGAINGLSSIIEKKDDLFRQEVQTIYNQIQQTNSEILASGITSATTLEQNMISFSTLLGGKDNASRFLEDVRQFAAVTPFETDGLLNTAKTLLSYGYKQDEIIPLMYKVGDAGSALGMDENSMNWVATSLGRMRSSGKATLEYLNPLIERGIPAIQYLSESLGKSVGEVYDLISKGNIDGVKAATVISNAMGEQYAGNMQLQSGTTSGLTSTLDDALKEINRYQGEGFNQQRKIGLQNEIAAYSGSMGEEMKDAYKLIGMFEADLENKHQQMLIDAIKNVQETEEYKLALSENDKVKIGELYSKARAEAETKYKNSDIYQAKLQNELNLIGDIQNAIIDNGAYMKFGETMANEFTKGWNSVRLDNLDLDSYHEDFQIRIDENYNTQTNLANEEYESWLKEMGLGNGNATGLDRVPYTGLFLLHEGEKITAKHDIEDGKSTDVPIINLYVTGSNKEQIVKEVAIKINNALENLGEVS